MDFRARLRRAFPYLVIGIGGFALAYVIIFVFVLPSKIVPPPKQPYTPDSSGMLKPIDTSVVHVPVDTGFPEATVPMAEAPVAAPDQGPTDVPDLVGMALSDARAVLNSYRLNASVNRDTSSFQPPNTVLRQRPEAGGSISSGGTVTLTVSYFPPEASESTSSRSTVSPSPRPSTPPVTAPRPAAPPGSTSSDTSRTVPRRPLPPIIPTDSAPPPPRHDTTPNPA